ncbi:Hpt domain-containing protein [Natranaerofaba carboxydovora]|uniref:Hpt domain-containing protein n=1 Tax=Natranaerofaba carboxydovora TaxID=2742683 RepID=UPI001F1370AD|nr:Hpt domain-containing protein [Natranaerofaba carboxydovora]UMZ72671.1 Hpt domain protein [Natranaerofaba carboxydovora]
MSKNTVYVDEDLKELIPDFMENRYEDIKKLKSSISTKDYEDIRKLGHTIKGVGGGYGFDYVTELGYKIEEAAKNGDEDLLNELIFELENHLDNVEIVYE